MRSNTSVSSKEKSPFAPHTNIGKSTAEKMPWLAAFTKPKPRMSEPLSSGDGQGGGVSPEKNI